MGNGGYLLIQMILGIHIWTTTVWIHPANNNKGQNVYKQCAEGLLVVIPITRASHQKYFCQILSFLKYLLLKCTVIKIIISWFENISCRSVRICTSVSSIPGARRSAPLTYCSHHSLFTRFFLSSYSTTPFHFISSNQSNVLFSYSNIPLISRFDIFHGSIEKWITMLGN